MSRDDIVEISCEVGQLIVGRDVFLNESSLAKGEFGIQMGGLMAERPPILGEGEFSM